MIKGDSAPGDRQNHHQPRWQMAVNFIVLGLPQDHSRPSKQLPLRSVRPGGTILFVVWFRYFFFSFYRRGK